MKSGTGGAVKLALSRLKYKVIAGVFAAVAFTVLYYFLVAKVADKSIWISVMMSGEMFVTFSVVSILITSVLSGILVSMILFKFDTFRGLEGGGFFGFVGSGVAAFGVGCPTCGASLFGLIGMPLALTYLPFSGLELQFLGILVLFVSIYFTGKSINGSCKVETSFTKDII